MTAEAQLAEVRRLQHIALIIAVLIGFAAALMIPPLHAVSGYTGAVLERYFGQPIILAQIGVLVAVIVYSGTVAARLGSLLATSEGDRRLVAEVESMTDPIFYAVWLLPVSGFVGTVIGVSAAIAPLDGLLTASGAVDKGAIDQVLAGLNVAFDTTLFGLVSVIPAMAVSMAMTRMTERRIARLWPSPG